MRHWSVFLTACVITHSHYSTYLVEIVLRPSVTVLTFCQASDEYVFIFVYTWIPLIIIIVSFSTWTRRWSPPILFWRLWAGRHPWQWSRSVGNRCCRLLLIKETLPVCALEGCDSYTHSDWPHHFLCRAPVYEVQHRVWSFSFCTF